MFRPIARPLLICLLLLIALPQQAQISLGINAGVTRMKFSGDPPDGIGYFSPQAGYSSALQMGYRFQNGLALNVQPGFSVLRSKYSFWNDSATRIIDSTYFKFKTFSLPLQAVVWAPGGRFYVLAGFELLYTLDFDGKVSTSPIPTSSGIYKVSEYNFFAQFGAGFIIPIGRPFLNFELRYSQGLNDMSTPLIHANTELPRTKLTNINLHIGFHIPLGNPEVFSVIKK